MPWIAWGVPEPPPLPDPPLGYGPEIQIQSLWIFSQFAQLPIRPSNQLAPLKYRASWYLAIPAKLLAAI